jgi:hypothetical protein
MEFSLQCGRSACYIPEISILCELCIMSKASCKFREGPDPCEVPGGGGLRVQAGGRLPLPDQGHQGHHHQPQARRLGQNRWAHSLKMVVFITILGHSMGGHNH